VTSARSVPSVSTDDKSDTEKADTEGDTPRKAKLDSKGRPITERPKRQDSSGPAKVAVRLGLVLGLFLVPSASGCDWFSKDAKPAEGAKSAPEKSEEGETEGSEEQKAPQDDEKSDDEKSEAKSG
jgi:hypothetical protein